VPPELIRLGLTMLGRGRQWGQLGEQLVVNPGKLVTAGWRPVTDTVAELAAMAAL
jgi:UDP-glucose 4-epimerase